MNQLKLTQLLLLYNQENSVKKLPVFDQVVKVVQQLKLLSPSMGRADSIEDSVLSYNRNQFLNQKNQQNERDSGQKQIMNLEEDLELERGLFAHKRLAPEYNNKISNASNNY